jgi:thiamine kinase-like enzyme
MTKFQKITQTNPFNEVWELSIGSNIEIFIKKKKKRKKYQINNIDLSPVFYRNSHFFIKNYKKSIKKTPLNKYVRNEIYVGNNITISFGYGEKETKLSKLIETSSLTAKNCYSLLLLSIDVLNTQKLTHHIYDDKIKIRNKNILDAKFELQILNPLLYNFSESTTKKFISDIGNPEYLCHGDLQPKNLFLSKENELRVIDFEECFWGHHGWDIGFLWGNIFAHSLNNANHKLLLMNYDELISKIDVKSKFNVIIFTISTLLMRKFDFPFKLDNIMYKEEIDNTINHLIEKIIL